MRKLEISCDTCSTDITYTGNCVDYRILLQSEPIGSKGGAVTAMMIYPQIEIPKHFCNMVCLKEWVNK